MVYYLRKEPERYEDTEAYRVFQETEAKEKSGGVNWGFTEDAWDDDNDFDEHHDMSKKPAFLKVIH